MYLTSWFASQKKIQNNSCLFKDYYTLGIRLRILHTLFHFILRTLHISFHLIPTLARRSVLFLLPKNNWFWRTYICQLLIFGEVLKYIGEKRTAGFPNMLSEMEQKAMGHSVQLQLSDKEQMQKLNSLQMNSRKTQSHRNKHQITDLVSALFPVETNGEAGTRGPSSLFQLLVCYR